MATISLIIISPLFQSRLLPLAPNLGLVLEHFM